MRDGEFTSDSSNSPSRLSSFSLPISARDRNCEGNPRVPRLSRNNWKSANSPLLNRGMWMEENEWIDHYYRMDSTNITPQSHKYP